MKPALNEFSGEDGLFRYLDPLNGQYTPLVELPEAVNPYLRDYNIHVHAKLLSALPMGNIKSLPAYFMLAKGNANGKAKKIIESSSGNTAASLGIWAKHFGFESVHAFISHEITEGKLKLLQLFDVKPIVNQEPICPSENDITSGIFKARQKGAEDGWYNPDQYANPANIEAHYEVTGRQVWEQTEGRIDYFCAGMGTTGTLIGCGRYLKERKPEVKVIGVVRAPNNPIPGPRTRKLLEDVSFDWSASCDEVIEIGTRDAYEWSLKMVRHGLMVGPSSGMNLAGLYAFIAQQTESGNFVKGQKPVHLAFPCCDLPFLYMDEYFSCLPAQAFPEIENRHLLPSGPAEAQTAHPQVKHVQPGELAAILAGDMEDCLVVDVRSRASYADYSLPHAINIPQDEFISNAEIFSKLYADRRVYFICNMGRTSALVAEYAVAKRMNAHSLEGGLMEWSRLGLPRLKPSQCSACGETKAA
jgi:cysteine synthase/rhodanese-related sulfurtransferase